MIIFDSKITSNLQKIIALILIISFAGFLSLFPPQKVFAATGDITAIRIIGDATGVTDAASACNTSSACTGWVAEVDVSGVIAGGTYSLGIGANNSPTSAKLSCTVTSLGYDTSGSATTISRTIYGTHQLRKIYDAGYTAPYPNDETLVSSTLTLRIALSDFIYSPDTNITCNIGAGIYNDGTNSSNAATGVVATNSSTLSYPRVIANWSWPGWTRINSGLDGDSTNHSDGSFSVRAVGFQRHAMNSKPLAAMLFVAHDAHGNYATTTVNNMTIDSTIADASKVQEYVGTFSTAQVNTFTQGDLITVDFKAYPWVGDSGAVMDTSDGVNTQPTPLYAPQYYINDRLGTFGTAAAVVDASAGNDSTCVAVSEATFNASPNSNDANTSPCATINKAGQVIRAWNTANASPARTDQAGTVWVKAGSYVWTGASVAFAASSGTNPDKAWLTVTPFPGVAKADVVITGITDTTYNKVGTTPLRVKGLTINVTSGAPNNVFQGGTGGTRYIWIDNNNLTMTSGSGLVYYYGAAYWTHNAVVSNDTCGNGALATCVKSGFTSFSSTAPAAQVRGNTLTGIANAINSYTILGNVFASPVANTSFKVQSTETAIPVISTQPIIAFNRLTNLQNTSIPFSVFATQSSPIGAAIVQNLLEWNNGTAGLASSASDASTNTPVNNVLFWNNTLVGGRINRCYNDNGSALRLRTLWSEVGNVYDAAAMKHDTFATANAARVGAWACLYGVGWRGSMDAAAPSFAQAGQWQPEFSGLNSDFIAIATSKDAQSTYQAPHGDARTLAYPGFVDRKSWDGSTQGAGNGDYHLIVTSPARSLISSTQAVLPYDLDGVARKNDGTGAAGAYEYVAAGDTTSPTVSDGTIITSSVTSSSLTLSWTKATDDTSTQGSLVYRVYRSSSNNINSVANIFANGTAVNASTTDIATLNVSSLDPATTYYFNVVVADEAGNASVYTTKSETTSAALSSDTSITSFNFASPATTGTVDNTAHTVALTVPFGTSKTSLTPTIVLATGATISPTSGTAEDFTNPVTYTVTAENSSTQDYVVTVTVAANTAKAVTAFNFNSLSPAVLGTIDEGAKTVTLTVPYGTTLTALVPTITHTGASINPASGVAHNFSTSPQTYTVTAANASTQAYQVTVNVTPASTDTNITSFDFTSPSVTGTVNNTAHTVALTVPYGTSVTGLTPTIVPATGATISPTSGTATDFTNPVTYTVTAQDGTTNQAYTVTVTVAADTTPAPTPVAGGNGPVVGSLGGHRQNISNLLSTTTNLASLQNQIAQLTAQLNSLLSQTQNTTYASYTSYNFTRDLYYRMVGNDVLHLQQFLNTHGFILTTTELGAPGQETDKFGLLTYKALQKFQASVGLPATGFFGPMTREYVNSVNK